MRPTLALRDLTPATVDSHADALVGLGRDIPGEYWTVDHLLMDLPDKWRLSFVGWRADRPVAYAVLSRKGPDTVHLHHLMVGKDERGMGVGTAMMAEMVRRARQGGADWLTLKVATENDRACSFYLRHEFEEIGRSGGYRTLRRGCL